MANTMLEKIYGSTLFKASTNKDAIKSALNNPMNMELVQQLREYLDDDTLERLNSSEPEFDAPGMFSDDVVDDTETTEDAEADNAKPAPTSAPSHSSANPATFTTKEDHMDDLKEFENSEDTVPASEPKSEDGPKPPESDSVESSTIIQKKLDLEALQGTLNAREDTAGVSYILQKDDELWIHYNDSINLNNVMEAVITLVRDLGYDNLVFNRLARSANAVVFEIVITNINNYTMTTQEEK